MKLILKQKGDYVQAIYRHEPNYLEVLKKTSIELYDKKELVFQSTIKSWDTNISYFENNNIFVVDYPIIKRYNLKTKEEIIYSDEILTLSSYFNVYSKDKVLLIKRRKLIDAPFMKYQLEQNKCTLLWKSPPLNVKQYEILVTENGYIFVPDYDLTVITTLDDSDGSLLWQFDISQLGTYYDNSRIDIPPQERTRKINKIYYSNDKVIVTFSRGIIALHPQTGKLLWKILFDDRYTDNLIFDGNIVYSGCGFCYTVIDIEQGKVLYANDQQTQEKVIIGNKELLKRWIPNRSFCLRKEFVWSYMRYNARYYLLKLEPSTGEVVDGCALSIGVSQDPVIIENTIYIRDMDGTLNIFELEE